MTSRILAAGLACFGISAATPAWAQDILTPYGHISLQPGQSIHAAITKAGFLTNVIKPGKARRAATGVSPQAADSPPRITSGAVVSGTLNVTDPTSVPVLQFKYATGSAGFNAAAFEFTAPNGQNGFYLPFYAGAYSRNGNVVFAGQHGAPYFSQPGNWVLTAGVIVDSAGNRTSYDAAQLAALFPNAALNVINSGPVDITPPVVTAGHVLTPKVSLSSPLPAFRATLSGTDDLTGVEFGYVVIAAPNTPYGQTETTYAPFAFTHGAMEVAAPLFAGQSPGTWTIVSYYLCDVAGNCSTNSQTPGDIKAFFGTNTFTVTN